MCGRRPVRRRERNTICSLMVRMRVRKAMRRATMRAKMSEGRRVSGGAAFQPHAHKGSHVWEENR